MTIEIEKTSSLTARDTIHRGRLQLIMVILFIITAFGASKILHAKRGPIKRADAEKHRIFVEIAKIVPAEHQINFDVTGILKARTNVDIIPNINGRILEINEQFFAGGSFKADEILFKIDPRNFAFEVSRLKAQVAAANTVLALEKAESKAAIAEWNQLKPDQAVPMLVARKPHVLEAESNLESAKAQLGLAQLNLARTDFKLPFDGKVLSTQLAVGQYAVTGQKYGEAFETASLEAKASLSDGQLKWLLSDKNLEVTISATHLGERKNYRGFLKRNASFLDEETRLAAVNFGILDEIGTLLPGTFLDINIKGSTLNNVILVPIQALQKEGNIWLIDKDNNLKSVIPEIIYSDDKKMVLKSISEEQIRIVTSYVSGAENGMGVEVITK